MNRIMVTNVSKKFKIGSMKEQSALSKLISFFSGREPQQTFWPLKEVSFSADSGEIVGIIGENGSGKSTLLRMIAGIYEKNGGEIECKGKIISLINLKDGIYAQLTMKDNIYFICSLFGLSQEEIINRFNSIVAFSELENFINTKTYQFSEGMIQRLVFSIGIHCNPEILLLDEVFEVEDERFKIITANSIKKLTENGATVVAVSHSLEFMERFCDRVIWIEGGKIKKQGAPIEIIEEYKK